MSETSIAPAFWWKKLHSLSGIIPIGIFLLEHIFTNSFAIYGAERFNAAVHTLRSLPYVFFIEIGGIALPILYHALYGVVIYMQGRPNNLRYAYPRNWMYTIQRLSGVFLLIFIVTHVWETRIHVAITGEPMTFDFMVQKLSNPLTALYYAAGMLTACYHLANGVWSFMIGWGITTTEAAMKRSAYACIAGGVLLAGLGINGMLGFLGKAFMLDY
jgi:succinate dehydrogenase / fumarate reductase cytochrome b subunit